MSLVPPEAVEAFDSGRAPRYRAEPRRGVHEPRHGIRGSMF